MKPEQPATQAEEALYQKFMATKTKEEADALYNGLSQAEVTALRTWLEENDKLTALEEHLRAITPEGEPVTMPIVSFTKVGPMLAAPARKVRMMRAAADQDDSGIVLNKSAKIQADGSYQITMEAYATGASSTTISTEPADIVLVLDVSGSMDDKMTQYQKVYAKELDKDKHYYVEKNGQYQEIHWRGWPIDSWGNWLDSYTPKESAADSNRNHVQFYQLTISQETKLQSLQNAVNNFITSVADKSPDSNIALVKFAGRKTDSVGNNTYRDGQYTYNYTQIVRNLTAASKSADLKGAVNELKAAGATAADYGMQHAQTIINGAANDGKKKVVIMFTDGEPNHHSGFDGSVANATITASKNMKTAGTTVYTIGVFSGANGMPVSNLNSLSNTNKYMHLVSSNYKDATAMNSPGTATYPTGGKSYYLSAGSADELNSIFQQISQEVGGSTSKLDEKAVIQDIVTPYFNLPANASDVQVYTAESDGSTDQWKDKVAFDGTVSIQDNTVSVSGFSYKDNWCGSHTEGGYHHLPQRQEAHHPVRRDCKGRLPGRQRRPHQRCGIRYLRQGWQGGQALCAAHRQRPHQAGHRHRCGQERLPEGHRHRRPADQRRHRQVRQRGIEAGRAQLRLGRLADRLCEPEHRSEEGRRHRHHRRLHRPDRKTPPIPSTLRSPPRPRVRAPLKRAKKPPSRQTRQRVRSTSSSLY